MKREYLLRMDGITILVDRIVRIDDVASLISDGRVVSVIDLNIYNINHIITTAATGYYRLEER